VTARAHVGEYDTEPVRGLPEDLPAGERILWQGAPRWQGLARRALHVRKVALYFGLLVLWRAGAAIAWGEDPLEAARAVSILASLGALAVGILAGIAWLEARATVYTITDRRVVLRFGVALTMAVNLPHRGTQAAGFHPYPDGTGDLSLVVPGAGDLGFVLLWPHVRPWRFGRRVEPMLRAVPDARAVAAVLARALAASADQPSPALPETEAAAAAPAGAAPALS